MSEARGRSSLAAPSWQWLLLTPHPIGQNRAPGRRYAGFYPPASSGTRKDPRARQRAGVANNPGPG